MGGGDCKPQPGPADRKPFEYDSIAPGRDLTAGDSGQPASDFHGVPDWGGHLGSHRTKPADFSARTL